MLIIPVIDLLDGNVVHAKKGMRERYRPVSSNLTGNSGAIAVLSALRALYPFQTFYIADLNAIQGNGDNFEIIHQLTQLAPDCRFWVDAGIANIEKNTMHGVNPNIRPVLGTETEVQEQRFNALLKQNDVILSLDLNRAGLLANQHLLDNPGLWPETIILMLLHRVGSGDGPDLDKIKMLASLNPARRYYAAGGIKDYSDLKKLETLNLSGALLATSLHNGMIGREDIQRLED